ncbi:MAG: hypothetical protein A2W23_09910 [Planctomycetes bacterium RBG_16_43_13]|nr:MAG: hypothetical protein A2W23_09910 [Planctomycetes bacterium RBG_16_43_13]
MHQHTTALQSSEKLPKIVLVGNPNVGKSVVFNLFTSRYVTVSNYPGTTVELANGIANIKGIRYSVLDTPGVNSLVPMSEDEVVTRDILLKESPEVVVQVSDAKNLGRTLFLTLQLAEMGIPMVLNLNMWDEAMDKRIVIDTAKLSELLGVKVITTIATHRKGTTELVSSISNAQKSVLTAKYSSDIEDAISRIVSLLSDLNIPKRAISLMLLSGDATLKEWLKDKVTYEKLSQIESIVATLQSSYAKPLGYIINEQRQSLVEEVVRSVQKVRQKSHSTVADKIGSLCMHPVLGVFVLAAVLYAMWWFVGKFGAGDAVDLIESRFFGGTVAEEKFKVSSDKVSLHNLKDPNLYGDGDIRITATNSGGDYVFKLEEKKEDAFTPLDDANIHIIKISNDVRFSDVRAVGGGTYTVNFAGGGDVVVKVYQGLIIPFLSRVIYDYSPSKFLTRLLVGEYGVLTMAITYALAIVFPIIITFFLFFSFLEDSGYLPRLAIMSNRIFKMMGLNGKAVLPMVLGLGCDTMATLTTRILETKRERIVVTLLLTLGVPCSAQLGVILGMVGSPFTPAGAIWLGIIILVIFVVGYLASKVLPGDKSDFVLEIPPIRFPQLSNILIKTLARLEWYVKEAVPLFIIGTLVLFALDELNLLVKIQDVASPIITGLLGLPKETTGAFVIGFLRRDYGAAGLFSMDRQGLLTANQAVVSLVTITLFVPCIAQFLVSIKERGLKTTLYMVTFVFVFAIGVGALLNLFFKVTGIVL